MGGKEFVQWKSTINVNRTLNGSSLNPNDDKEDSNRMLSNAQHRLENSISRSQQEMDINDAVGLDEFNPWLRPPEEYGVAITGKAFNLLLSDPN